MRPDNARESKNLCAYTFWTVSGRETAVLQVKRCPGTSPWTYELRNSGKPTAVTGAESAGSGVGDRIGKA